MSAIVEEARRSLISGGLIASLGALQPDRKLGGFAFDCELPVPHPNSEGLPARVRVRVRVPEQFPLSKVEFILDDPTLWGFAHQDGRTGAICLKPEDEYPYEASARLQAYSSDAIDWLERAANGTLLSPGERWELPDFRTTRSDRPPVVLPLEDANTFAMWENRVGQHGTVQLSAHVHGAGLVPTRFERSGEEVLQPKVNEGFLDRRISILGRWILLPSHIFVRHRPARTFAELQSQCRALGIDFWSIFHRASKAKTYKGYHYLLVGAPIPEVFQGPSVVVNWQAIAIPSRDLQQFGHAASSRARGTGKSTRSARLRGALHERLVPWGESVPYPESRSTARGSLAAPAKSARVCLLGCGALGSPIGEHLARGGVRELAFFDSELLELENLSRHELSPLEVGQSKAAALARRLNGIHSGANVRGFPLSLPPPPLPRRRDRLAWNLLDQADVLIDCTTSKSAFLWASRLGRQRGKLVVHMFINANARMLTICVSGQHISCARVFELLKNDITEGRAAFGMKEYDGDGERLDVGAGCWQSTFPAVGSNIAVLAAAAVPIVEEAIRRGRSSRGTAIVLRRREIDDSAAGLAAAVPEGLVERVWAKDYR